MLKLLKQIIQTPLPSFRYKFERVISNANYVLPVEFEEVDCKIFRYVFKNKLTMVSPQRLIATIQACKYVVENQIDGDFVECGVWRGGNSIAAKMVFEAYGCDKQVILFDTFAGMTEPTNFDKTVRSNLSAKDRYLEAQNNSHNEWCYASLDDVRNNFKNARVNIDDLRFIKGDVLETLSVKENIPDQISVLRLDTDWYESTKQEMTILYPLLAVGGTLLIDDYGHWDGARKAIEEYFDKARKQTRPLLQYTDYTGRMGIKL